MSLLSLPQCNFLEGECDVCLAVTYGSVSHEGSFLIPVGLRLSGVLPPALLFGCHRILSCRFARVCVCVLIRWKGYE